MFQSNITKLNLIRMFFWMHFFSAVLVPFYTDWGHLSLSQILILNAWFMFWNFVLEIPTGTVADYLGRKASLILGSAVAVLATLVYISKPDFNTFLIAEIISAAAYTLHSGADESLAYDSLKALGQESRSKKVFARMESFKLGGIIIAACTGGFIAQTWGLRSSMFLYVIPASCACLVALFLKEPPIYTHEKRPTYLTILKEGTSFFLKNRVLLILSIEAALTNALAWGIIWLYQPLLKAAGMTMTYFGIVQTLSCLGQILVLSNISRIENFFGARKRLLVIGGMITGIAFVLLSLIHALIWVIPLIVISFSFGLTRMPVFSSYMNKYIPSEKRATVLSVGSMLRTLGIVLINPLIGFLADRSIYGAVLFLGLGFVLLSVLTRIQDDQLKD